MEFGIAMTSVAYKMQEYAKTQNAQEAYLSVLRDLTQLSSNQNLKAIEIFSLPPFDAKLLSGLSREVKDSISSFDVSCHLPFADPNPDSFHEEVRKVAVKEIEDVIEFASGVGIKKVILHPGFRDIVYPEFYVLFGQNSKTNIEKVTDELIGFCRERGVSLFIENMPSPDPFYTKPEEFTKLIEKGASITLDPAHAVFSGVNPVAFVEKLGKSIAEVHLQDASKDKHLEMQQLGTGDVNYVELLNALEKIDFKGQIILEMRSEKAVMESIALLKKSGYIK